MGSIGLVMQEMVKAEHQLLDYQIRSRGLDLKLSGDLLCKSVGALTHFCLPAEKYRAGRCVTEACTREPGGWGNAALFGTWLEDQ
jgi:hypothetical protein